MKNASFTSNPVGRVGTVLFRPVSRPTVEQKTKVAWDVVVSTPALHQTQCGASVRPSHTCPGGRCQGRALRATRPPMDIFND
jgi:hypothetical protein